MVAERTAEGIERTAEDTGGTAVAGGDIAEAVVVGIVEGTDRSPVLAEVDSLGAIEIP